MHISHLSQQATAKASAIKGGTGLEGKVSGWNDTRMHDPHDSHGSCKATFSRRLPGFWTPRNSSTVC